MKRKSFDEKKSFKMKQWILYIFKWHGAKNALLNTCTYIQFIIYKEIFHSSLLVNLEQHTQFFSSFLELCNVLR